MAATDDFDISSLLQIPVQLIGVVVGAAETAKQTMSTMVETVQSLQRSAAALEAMLVRMESVVSNVESANSQIMSVVNGIGDLQKRLTPFGNPISDLLNAGKKATAPKPKAKP
jgi:hypothetical protein